MANIWKKITSILQLKTCWQIVFDKDKAQVKVVLADLKEFCDTNLTEGCGAPLDMHRVAIKIGKQQVWKFMLERLNITEEDVQKSIEEEN